MISRPSWRAVVDGNDIEFADLFANAIWSAVRNLVDARDDLSPEETEDYHRAQDQDLGLKLCSPIGRSNDELPDWWPRQLPRLQIFAEWTYAETGMTDTRLPIHVDPNRRQDLGYRAARETVAAHLQSIGTPFEGSLSLQIRDRNGAWLAGRTLQDIEVMSPKDKKEGGGRGGRGQKGLDPQVTEAMNLVLQAMRTTNMVLAGSALVTHGAADVIRSQAGEGEDWKDKLVGAGLELGEAFLLRKTGKDEDEDEDKDAAHKPKRIPSGAALAISGPVADAQGPPSFDDTLLGDPIDDWADWSAPALTENSEPEEEEEEEPTPPPRTLDIDQVDDAALMAAVERRIGRASPTQRRAYKQWGLRKVLPKLRK